MRRHVLMGAIAAALVIGWAGEQTAFSSTPKPSDASLANGQAFFGPVVISPACGSWRDLLTCTVTAQLVIGPMGPEACACPAAS